MKNVKTMKKAWIFCHGPSSPSTEMLKGQIQPGDFIICADGGAEYAMAMDLAPLVIIGDLDSLSREDCARAEKSGARFITFPREKDKTDAHLGLEYAARQGAREVVLVGALGGRIDHALGNLYLLLAARQLGMTARIIDAAHEVYLLLGDEWLDLEGEVGQTISLIPVAGDVGGVWTEGLYYPLRGEPLLLAENLGISNLFTGTRARVEIETGTLLIIKVISEKRARQEGAVL